jgi:phytoene synthase
MDLYTETCFECSKIITQKYSTSFSQGIKAFDKRFRYPVYAIYGFVRFADEIVDTFNHQNRAQLIADFKDDTFKAISEGISLNPVLQSFQQVVNQYHIEQELIEAFLLSMEMDLEKTAYDQEGYQAYVYGSAEVVGLMCLRVFCEGDVIVYPMLVDKARSLGSAFQKINFLRDVKSDYEERGRTYFPEVDFKHFTEADKQKIEADIQLDFDEAYIGIKQLPDGTKIGVYIAYLYYLELFKKIKKLPANVIIQKRIRVNNLRKKSLYFKAIIKEKLNMI